VTTVFSRNGPLMEPRHPLKGGRKFATARRKELHAQDGPQGIFTRCLALLAGAENPSEGLRRILALLTEKMWFTQAAVYAFDGRHFHCVAHSKSVVSASIPCLSEAGSSPFIRVAKTRKPVYLNDTSGLQALGGSSEIKSLYVVPLVVRTRVYGVLSVHTNERGDIREAYRDLIERFALPAALALERMAFHRHPDEDGFIVESLFAQDELGVAQTALDGTIQRANPALARLLGRSPAGLAGRRTSEFVPAEERKQFRQAEWQIGKGKPHPGFDLHRYVRYSGETVWCATKLSLVLDAEGKPASLLTLVADASARKQAADARDRLKDELLQSQRVQTLGMLAGGVAHDFNNALEVIMGFASLARLRLSPGDPLQEPLMIIEESAEGAAMLAHELLEAARSDKPRAYLVDVGELVSAVMKIVTRTFDRKIRVEHRVEKAVPGIRGFRTRFEQALLNLCLNARDAMPTGGTLTVEATAETLAAHDPRLPDSSPPGSYAHITVRDTGVGMSPQVMQDICKPLFTTKASGQNAGLGLTMVERIVRDSGGFLRVASVPSKGSEFALYLPADLTESRLPLPTPSSRLVPGRGTVLVVDDEPRVLDFLEKGLTRLGYEVFCAESGKVACEVYSQQPRSFTCVLLDLIMPEMSGLETYARLRDINPQVKVILSSGYSSERIKGEAMEAGGVEFLGKPYSLETLSQALQKIQLN
jgi:two-component system, cell cycle sensor histidine kinase and response regulator CckA